MTKLRPHLLSVLFQMSSCVLRIFVSAGDRSEVVVWDVLTVGLGCSEQCCAVSVSPGHCPVTFLKRAKSNATGLG